MELTVDKNLKERTITVVARFDHPIDRVWDLYTDPRKLERWWGPPTYPATVTEHDLTPGGIVRYYMTSPEGETYHGLWAVQHVDAPKGFTVIDAFADAEGNRMVDMPESTASFSFAETEEGSQMTSVTTFASLEAIEQVLQMGMEEGLTAAMGQMEPILAEN